jgi:hypothetical protein
MADILCHTPKQCKKKNHCAAKKDCSMPDGMINYSKQLQDDLMELLRNSLADYVRSSDKPVYKLGEEIGLSGGQLERILSGQRGIDRPQLDTVLKIILHLNLIKDVLEPIMVKAAIPEELKKQLLPAIAGLENYIFLPQEDRAMICSLLQIIAKRLEQAMPQ